MFQAKKKLYAERAEHLLDAIYDGLTSLKALGGTGIASELEIKEMRKIQMTNPIELNEYEAPAEGNAAFAKRDAESLKKGHRINPTLTKEVEKMLNDPNVFHVTSEPFKLSKESTDALKKKLEKNPKALKSLEKHISSDGSLTVNKLIAPLVKMMEYQSILISQNDDLQKNFDGWKASVRDVLVKRINNKRPKIGETKNVDQELTKVLDDVITRYQAYFDDAVLKKKNIFDLGGRALPAGAKMVRIEDYFEKYDKKSKRKASKSSTKIPKFDKSQFQKTPAIIFDLHANESQDSKSQ